MEHSEANPRDDIIGVWFDFCRFLPVALFLPPTFVALHQSAPWSLRLKVSNVYLLYTLLCPLSPSVASSIRRCTLSTLIPLAVFPLPVLSKFIHESGRGPFSSGRTDLVFN